MTLSSFSFGGIVGAGILYVIASGSAGFSLQDGFAANGYGTHSPGQLWLFWVAPIVGALLGGLAYRYLFEEQRAAGA